MWQIQVKNGNEWNGERRWYFSEDDAKEIAELIYRNREYRVVEAFPVFGRGARHSEQITPYYYRIHSVEGGTD